MQQLIILSGAGISAESGINTFRDADGLWEGHDVMEVASPLGWAENPQRVLNFYNQRRQQLFTVSPNRAHEIIAELQGYYQVTVITQNVDDLHERAGSNHVIHLHGELKKVRSEQNPTLSYYWEDDVYLGEVADDGAQLRPDIVWFGEEVPLIETAIPIVTAADVILIIGTSLEVYPAAGLINYASDNASIYYIDPKANQQPLPSQIQCLPTTATAGMQQLLSTLIEMA